MAAFEQQAWLTTPLEFSGGHVFVCVDTIRDVWALVDTGAPFTIGSVAVPRFAFLDREWDTTASFAGKDARELSAMVGRTFDVLIGMNVLGCLAFELDVRNGCARWARLSPAGALPDWSASERTGRAVSIATGLFSGAVPTMRVQLEGVERTLIFDSGAKLSYLRARLHGDRTAVATTSDFHPLIGGFELGLFAHGPLTCGTAADALVTLPSVCFGRLPESLAGMLEEPGGPEGILGSELLAIGVLRCDFARQQMVLLLH